MLKYMMILGLTLGCLNAPAQTTFDEAKVQYAGMLKGYEADIQSINRQEADATNELRVRIDEKKAERNKCQSFPCAKELEEQIEVLESECEQKREPFQTLASEREGRFKAEAMKQAFHAYANELVRALQANESGWKAKVLQWNLVETCDLKDHRFTAELPASVATGSFSMSSEVACVTAVVDLRKQKGSDFEFVRVHYSLAMDSETKVADLNKLFSLVTRRFVYPIPDGEDRLWLSLSRLFTIGTNNYWKLWDDKYLFAPHEGTVSFASRLEY
jgi:hypothetical protein